jgi:hypothetical protein
MLQSQPSRTYRVTWDELMRHSNEIVPGAVLEVKVFEPEHEPIVDQENQALIALLHAWREEDATDDPRELERRDTETDALMRNLQASRLSLRTPEA